MKRNRPGNYVIIALILASLVIFSSCGKQRQIKQSSNVIQYLYPDQGEIVVSPSLPTLSLPIRAGIAFVPATGETPLALNEKQKFEIMDQIANDFSRYTYIKSIERIPSSYLQPGGGFANLDRIRAMYGFDVIALVSYDQIQNTDNDSMSIMYWTLIGAYYVKAERNETSTMMDTAVYDIASRKLLFRAAGTSQIKATATPVNLSEQLRNDSYKGFVEANKAMINNLHGELEKFTEKVKTRPQDYKVTQ